GLTQGSQIPVVRVNPELREEYRAAIEDLLMLDGPKFLIADKECGITYHRRKRRAAAAEEQRRGFLAVEEHVLVNEDACEHCLECTSKTGCPGLDFVDTLHGPKVQTHASHCVNDLACARIKACPSFEKVVVRRKKAPKRPVADIRDVPTPTLAQPGPDGVWRAYMAGIGGMGIGATTALLVRAAQEMGYYVQFCDKKGIAIRGGGVYAHVAITKEPMVLSPVHPYGSADLVVGVDLLEAARSVDAGFNLRVASPERTFCVVNSTRHPTTRALMGIESWDNATLEAALKERSKPDGYWSGETSPLCQEYLGSTLYDNSLLMGAAYQLGLLPVTSQSLHKALKAAYRGVARSRNLQAFNIGREMVAHPERYGR
ncbi:MAG TPA: 2-oxoacid:acceptor oxidoreductase family protein, partial [bacterium]|nr:2-oxoacid:acceptor oxidoreductase family protein [bacterium]